MEALGIAYHSSDEKTEEQARVYLQTHKSPHRFLAYRDISFYIRKFVQGTRALDFGSGTGASAAFLHDLGFEVVGTDISSNMLEKARRNFPNIEFCEVQKLTPAADFDLVFSSFVLFEIASKEGIVQYLNKASSFLKNGGIFIGIAGSENLYSLYRNWMTFNANFEENQNLCSGDIAKLALKNPEMEFYDYYWKEKDYFDCFEKTNLKALQLHYPLGSPKESYEWKDELLCSPFIIFIAKKVGTECES